MLYKTCGTAGQEAAEYIREHVTKPVVGYVVGVSTPSGKTMAMPVPLSAGAVGLRRRRYGRWRVRKLRWQGVPGMWLGRRRLFYKPCYKQAHIQPHLICNYLAFCPEHVCNGTVSIF